MKRAWFFCGGMGIVGASLSSEVMGIYFHVVGGVGDVV